MAKWLYRLEATDPNNGLWYNNKNEYVWGCKDCKGDAKNFPMGYDERYHIDGKNWFSSCSNKEDLLHWYSKEDAKFLIDNMSSLFCGINSKIGNLYCRF